MHVKKKIQFGYFLTKNFDRRRDYNISPVLLQEESSIQYLIKVVVFD